MSILTPAISGVDNVWAYMGIFAFSNILWLFGINGSSIIFPIVFTLGITNSGLNADLINAGQSAEHIMNLQMYRYAVLGGGGNTLGLVLLMCFSHVKHLKTIGRLSLVPGICGINEPIEIHGIKSSFSYTICFNAMYFYWFRISCSKHWFCKHGIYCRSFIYTILCARILISIRYKKCYFHVCINRD